MKANTDVLPIKPPWFWLTTKMSLNCVHNFCAKPLKLLKTGMFFCLHTWMNITEKKYRCNEKGIRTYLSLRVFDLWNAEPEVWRDIASTTWISPNDNFSHCHLKEYWRPTGNLNRKVVSRSSSVSSAILRPLPGCGFSLKCFRLGSLQTTSLLLVTHTRRKSKLSLN